MRIASARIWLLAAVVVALAAVAVAWSASGSQSGGPVSALGVAPVPREAADGSQAALSSATVHEAPDEGKVAAAPPVEPAEASGEVASKALDSPADDSAPAPAMKQAAPEQDLRGGLRIGGHSRLMDSFVGVVDVDEADVAKTINVHILRDEDYRYYFDLDSQTVPAGEKVRFVVNNTHFTPDECW